MGWPQIIYIGLVCLSLGAALVKHGEPRPNWSFWASLTSAAIALGLLTWGGFFG